MRKIAYFSILFLSAFALQAFAQGQALPEGFSNKISIEVRATDLFDASKILAKKANANIAIHKDARKKIDLKLDDVTVNQAIDSLCKTYKLDYVVKDNIMIIFPKGRNLTWTQNSGRDMPADFQKMMTIDFKNAKIRSILKIITTMSDTQIVVQNDVHTKTSISFIDATIEQVFNTLCAIEDLRYEKNDNVFVVMPVDTEH